MIIRQKKISKPIFGKRFRYKSNYTNPYMSPIALEAKERVQAKIDDGTYKYETCNCYCGSNDSILISEIDRYGNYYPFVLCKKCGIMRKNPRLNKKAYIDFYSHEYRTLYGDKDRDMDELYKLRLKKAQERYDFITKYITLPPQTVVFDIGCGMGTMLLPFYQNGCEVMGVDYGVEFIKFGRKKTGLNLEIGGVEKLKDLGEKADLVILNHVLEHFLDLERELRTIGELMKPDGFIYIAVPGTLWWIKNVCGGNIMGILQNAHMWQLSLNSLRYVIECCGFEFIRGNEEIKSIFKVSNVFREKKNIPQDEFEKILAYLKNTEHKYMPKLYIVNLLELIGIKKILKNVIRKYSLFSKKI